MKDDLITATKWGLGILAVTTVLGLAGHALGVVGTALTAPGRVVNKTLQTDNIISSYEWFYDVNAQYQSRLGQIKGHRAIAKAETDPKERTRLSIELAAMQQSCRDLATRFNANSEKANKAIFKGSAVPQTLETSQCDA